MTDNQMFLKVFKQIEAYLRSTLKLDEDDHMSFNAMVFRSHDRVFKSHRNRELLDASAQLRNTLSHKYQVAIPHPAFLKRFYKLAERILAKKTVSSFMRPISKLKTIRYEDTLELAFKMMQQKQISNLPILNHGKIMGIFNESTLFYHLKNDKEALLDFKQTPLEIFKETMRLNEHPTVYYPFVSRHLLMDDLADLFEKDLLKDKKRLELVLVTENGKQEEALLGFLTPEDLILTYMND